jgi:hypothetical protein
LGGYVCFALLHLHGCGCMRCCVLSTGADGMHPAHKRLPEHGLPSGAPSSVGTVCAWCTQDSWPWFWPRCLQSCSGVSWVHGWGSLQSGKRHAAGLVRRLHYSMSSRLCGVCGSGLQLCHVGSGWCCYNVSCPLKASLCAQQVQWGCQLRRRAVSTPTGLGVQLTPGVAHLTLVAALILTSVPPPPPHTHTPLPPVLTCIVGNRKLAQACTRRSPHDTCPCFVHSLPPPTHQPTHPPLPTHASGQPQAGAVPVPALGGGHAVQPGGGGRQEGAAAGGAQGEPRG